MGWIKTLTLVLCAAVVCSAKKGKKEDDDKLGMSTVMFNFLMGKLSAATDLDLCTQTAARAVLPQLTKRCPDLTAKKCTQTCQYGYVINTAAVKCPTCVCKTADPCASKTCGSGEACRLSTFPRGPEKLNIFLAIGQCRKTSKTGTCMAKAKLQQMIQGNWLCNKCTGATTPADECTDDADCEKNEKCCDDGCNKRCMKPDAHPNMPLCLKLAMKLGMNGPRCTPRGNFAKKQVAPLKMGGPGQNMAWCVDPTTGIPVAGSERLGKQNADALDCSTITVPNCPTLDCSKSCAHGYVVSGDCATCACKSDPCQALSCSGKKICAPKVVQCVAAPCNPVYECIEPKKEKKGGPKNNHGSCGKHKYGVKQICPDDCKKDGDCADKQKCCYRGDGCGKTCSDALQNDGACYKERHEMLKKMRSVALNCDSSRSADLYIPVCTSDGRFARMQCCERTGMCWCVNVKTGAAIAGTKVRGLPDCDNPTTDQAVCPIGEKQAVCPLNLCLWHQCPKDKSVVCRVNPCGGCKIEFYDLSNNKVTDCFGAGACGTLVKQNMQKKIDEMSYDRNIICKEDARFLRMVYDSDGKHAKRGREAEKEWYKKKYDDKKPGGKKPGDKDKDKCTSFFMTFPDTDQTPTKCGAIMSREDMMMAKMQPMKTLAQRRYFGYDADDYIKMPKGKAHGYDKKYPCSSLLPDFKKLVQMLKENDEGKQPGKEEKEQKEKEEKKTESGSCHSETPELLERKRRDSQPADTVAALTRLWNDCQNKRVMLEKMNGMKPMGGMEPPELTNGCPLLSYGALGICGGQVCKKNRDCGSKKCCHNGCGLLCSTPYTVDKNTYSFGPHKPQCQADGTYQFRQCRGAGERRKCWCVAAATGNAVAGSLSNPDLQCDVSGKVSGTAISCTSGTLSICENACKGKRDCVVSNCDSTCTEKKLLHSEKNMPVQNPNVCILAGGTASQCANSVTFFSFDKATGLCNQHTGCAADENKFDTKELCESRCWGEVCPGETPKSCAKDICTRATCPQKRGVQCFVDKCTCTAKFLYGKQLVLDSECRNFGKKPKSTCQKVRDRIQKLAADLEGIDEELLIKPRCVKGRFDSKLPVVASFNATHIACLTARGKPILSTLSCRGGRAKKCEGAAAFRKMRRSRTRFRFNKFLLKLTAALIEETKVFMRTLVKSMGLLESQIGELLVEEGSIIVTMVLNGDSNVDVDLAAATDALTSQITSGNLNLTLNGQTYTADPNSLEVTYTEEPAPEPEPGMTKTAIIIIGVVAAVALLAIVAVAIYCVYKHSKAKSAVSDSNSKLPNDNPGYAMKPEKNFAKL